MNKIVKVTYDAESLQTTITVDGSIFDTSRIEGKEIADWAYPFMLRRIQWDGFYNEMVKALDGERKFSLIFNGSDEALAELREAWEDAPVTIISEDSSENIVVIEYDEANLTTDITINGDYFDTSRINGKEIEDWVYPFMIRKVTWNGIFEELYAVTETGDYIIKFSGSDKAIGILQEECPEGVSIINMTAVSNGSLYDVKWVSSDNMKMPVMSAVNNLKIQFAEAKKLVNSIPVVIATVNEKEAIDLKGKFESDGATIEIIKCGSISESFKLDNDELQKELDILLKFTKESEYDEEELEKAIDILSKAAYNGNTEACCGINNYINYLGYGVGDEEKVKWIEKAAQQGYDEAQYKMGCCYYSGRIITQDYNKAVKWFEEAVKQGNVIAQYMLGRCYYNGYGVEKDLREAVKWFEMAAEQGDIAAKYMIDKCYCCNAVSEKDIQEECDVTLNAEEQYKLGRCYYYGDGVERDYERAVEYFEEAVKLFGKSTEYGNDDAKYKLGICYYYGYGVEQNKEEAVAWFEKISNDFSFANAQYKFSAICYSFGRCYYYGDDFEEDKKEAIKWFEKAAKLGNTSAKYMLGICYYSYGIKKDKVKAVEWFEKAAEYEDSEAQYMLGKCYYNGYGVEKDKEEAVYWFEKAAKHGLSDAKYELGKCYYYGQGTEKDNEKAVKWFKEVAEYEDSEAQCMLGECYYYGRGVKQNYEEAVKFFERAAEQEHSKAQHMLGRCYYYGHGVEEDDEEAVKWFEEAAQQENSGAQYMLGECYYCGYGVEEDYIEAVKWYREAAERGHSKAQYMLGQCYYYGYGVEEDDEEAVKWFKMAAKQGYAEAQHVLGSCYYYGHGVKEDYIEAVGWLEKSAKQGNEEAVLQIQEIADELNEQLDEESETQSFDIIPAIIEPTQNNSISTIEKVTYTVEKVTDTVNRIIDFLESDTGQSIIEAGKKIGKIGMDLYQKKRNKKYDDYYDI